MVAHSGLNSGLGLKLGRTLGDALGVDLETHSGLDSEELGDALPGKELAAALRTAKGTELTGSNVGTSLGWTDGVELGRLLWSTNF